MGTNDPRGQFVKTSTTPTLDWQRVWFSTRQRGWSSLAIIPSDAGIDVGKVAEALASIGRQHGEWPVSLVNTVGVQLADVNQVIDSIDALTKRGECVLVPVDPITENPSTTPIVRAMSAALLVVRLGESQLSSARSVIDLVGRERLLGSVVLE
jgi:hypothetical protein